MKLLNSLSCLYFSAGKATSAIYQETLLHRVKLSFPSHENSHLHGTCNFNFKLDTALQLAKRKHIIVTRSKVTGSRKKLEHI